MVEYAGLPQVLNTVKQVFYVCATVSSDPHYVSCIYVSHA